MMPVIKLTPEFAKCLKDEMIVVDTNILIEFFDAHHFNHADTSALLNRFIGNNCDIVFFVATKLELYQHFAVTYFTSSFKRYVGHLRDEIDLVKSTQTDLINKNEKKIGDREFKRMRRAILMSSDGKGKDHWEEFLLRVMDGAYEKINLLNDAKKIRYIRKDELVYGVPPEWSDTEEFIFSQMMGSFDAAIYNLFEKSQLSYFLSRDGDFSLIFENRKPKGKAFLHLTNF